MKPGASNRSLCEENRRGRPSMPHQAARRREGRSGFRSETRFGGPDVGSRSRFMTERVESSGNAGRAALHDLRLTTYDLRPYYGFAGALA